MKYFALLLGVSLSFLSYLVNAEDSGSDKGKPVVLVSIRPLELIVNDLLGEHFQVVTLLQANVDPHNASLSFADRARLSKAAHLVWLGPEFETFLSKTTSGMTQGKSLPLDQITDVFWLGQGHDSHGHENGHGVDTDVHIWLDVQNAVRIIGYLAEAFAHQYPTLALQINQQKKVLEEQWIALDEQLLRRFSPHIKVPFGVYHDAYGYFVHRYSLNQVAAVNQRPEQVMAARKMMLFSQAMVGAKCLISERDGNSIRKLSDRLETPVIIADPLAGDRNLKTYSEFMVSLSESFSACLAGVAQ